MNQLWLRPSARDPASTIGRAALKVEFSPEP